MRMPVRIRPALLAAVLAVLAPAIACAQAPKKIDVGHVSPTAPNWPSFVAAEKGFFLREGVELEIIYVGNVANTVQQLVADRFDVASRPSTPRSGRSATAATP